MLFGRLSCSLLMMSLLLPACTGGQALSDSAAKQSCPKKSFSSQQGNIPLLLVNEHGADQSHAVWFIAEHTGEGVNRFVKQADQYTDIITEQIAIEVEKLSGKKPYVLIAEIPRNQIDFNRPVELAVESHRLRACYQDFHAEAARLVKEIDQRWQRGYLLDVHGQSRFPDKIMRGTRNGQTIMQLRAREGDQVYTGAAGLFGKLQAVGYPVMPAAGERELFYIGGYMLKTYGSHQPNGIDAVQIEIGRDFRVDQSRRSLLIKDVAAALVSRMRDIEILQ